MLGKYGLTNRQSVGNGKWTCDVQTDITDHSNHNRHFWIFESVYDWKRRFIQIRFSDMWRADVFSDTLYNHSSEKELCRKSKSVKEIRHCCLRKGSNRPVRRFWSPRLSRQGIHQYDRGMGAHQVMTTVAAVAADEPSSQVAKEDTMFFCQTTITIFCASHSITRYGMSLCPNRSLSIRPEWHNYIYSDTVSLILCSRYFTGRHSW